MLTELEAGLVTLLEEGDVDRLAERLSEVPVAEIATAMLELDPVDRAEVLRALSEERAALVFAELEGVHQDEILDLLGQGETRSLLEHLEPDDRTELLSELDDQETQELLSLLSVEGRREAQALLSFPEESVGRLMTPYFVAIQAAWTVGKALAHVRERGEDSETLNRVYVLDHDGRLLDDLRLRTLLLSDDDQPISGLMDHRFVHVDAHEDRELAVLLMQRHDLFALPVTDEHERLLGVVTVDDILDVLEDEVNEDFQRAVGVEPLHTTYTATSVVALFRRRIPWLFILVIVAMATAGIIAAFEATLETTVILAAFIPMLIGSGGNTGAQSATLIVRALATGDIEVAQWARTLGKEALVGILLGVIMGGAAALLGAYYGSWDPVVGLVVGLAMFFIVLSANMVGAMLPPVLTALDLDPAVASNPLIATIMDILGLFIYFGLATWLLGAA